VICPHCRASLKQKERPNRTCSACQRPFALDPKSNALLAHDLLVTRVADQLSDNGTLRYTGAQLWYALSRKALKNRSTGVGCGVGAAIVILAVTGFCAAASVQDGNTTLAVLMALAWLVVIATGVIAIANRRAQIPTIDMPVKWSEFSTMVLAPWRSVYQVDPPGLAKAADLSKVVDPRMAVLCPDRSVLFCLEANGVPERLKVALAARVDLLPVGVPVLILHDASPAGCLLAQRTRTALPGRQVMDGGLRPRAVMKAPGSIRLRTRPLAQEVQALAGTALDAEEQQWLAKGWWSPIGALRPAALIRRVEQAAQRTDPAHRAAQEVGFLTWPAG
jgi:hypothetical protein